MAAPYRATTVANEFIRRAKASGRTLTPMQLVKLTYIAHGWSLALLGRALIRDPVEAWKYGPVIPELYRSLKHYGSQAVTSSIPRSIFSGDEAMDDVDQRLIDEVYAKYGLLTGVQLSHLTHKPGTPWFRAYDPNGWGIAIPDDTIQQHYQDLAGRN